jgi:putative transposase
MAQRCRALRESQCAEKPWEILALAVQPDHVHLLVRVSPSERAAEVMKACKGITAVHLRREVAPLRRLLSMWTRNSFASTAGTVSQQTLQRSSEAQTER